MNTIAKTRRTTEDDITAEVLRRLEATEQPRLRQIMQSLVRHLHAFVKDVEPTGAEWETAIQFLTETGHMCSDRRQGFILLSDTLGVSMVVDVVNHRTPEGATESTIFGPFHRDGAPQLPAGGNIAPRDKTGVTTHIFDDTDPYLDSDTVFAVKDSLICTFQRHDARDEDAERVELEPPFCTAEFDFVLKPNRRHD